jgi:hypothetical protein
MAKARGATLGATLAAARDERVAAALRAAKGHIGAAAIALGMSRRMVTYYLANSPALRAVAEESRPKARK